MRYKLLLLALPVLLAAARLHATAPAKGTPPAVAKPGAAPSAFARFNLAHFWRLPSGLDGSSDKVHNGFFGYSYQRLEMVFTSVQRDARNPQLYHVRGKSRRYGIVRSFAGTFFLDKIQRYEASKSQYGDADGKAYLGTGRFVLREQSRGSDNAYGTFSGRLAVDFDQRPKGKLQLNQHTANEHTLNGGFLLDGAWKDAGTGAEVDVLMKNGMAVTHQVLEGFDVGERSPRISRRYTRVGWSSYWSNDEWWAEKPVARK